MTKVAQIKCPCCEYTFREQINSPAPTETLRDKFAMAAMQGEYAAAMRFPVENFSRANIVYWAYASADLALAEKARRESEDE